MPGRTRRPLQITIFLDFGPSRPRFSMILGTFCKYFKRCFAHCVRPPTCSIDASGQRFSFILVPFPAYFPYVLYMFRMAFCMPCHFVDLFQNRLDLDLVLRRSIGEACSIDLDLNSARSCPARGPAENGCSTFTSHCFGECANFCEQCSRVFGFFVSLCEG